MRLTRTLALLALLVAAALPAVADDTHPSGTGWTGARPDGHAPIGVMGDHVHRKGMFMLSYRYMQMSMDGNRDGTHGLGLDDVFAEGFMVAPAKMTMEMHMLGAMYGATDKLTLMAMLPYVRLSMDHVTRMGGAFTTKTDGIGDAKVTALYLLGRWGRQQLHLNAGIGLPTGSVDEKGDTPAGSNQKLPYPMQLGSGTVDLLPGITYVGQSDDWSWGGQLGATIRLGDNSEGYTLGNRVAATFWSARKWTDSFSTSVRLAGSSWGNVDGRDDELNPAMVPTADPRLRGGKRIDLLFGINLLGRRGALKGHRVALELGRPIYQTLDGPQLETDWSVTLGWQHGW